MTFAILSVIIQNDNKSNGGFVLSSLKECKDEELVKLSAAGDCVAEEELILRYSHYVRSLTRPYFLAGGDSEDLIQEGMIGFLKAISGFEASREASFRTFAALCIRTRIFSAIRHSNRGKNSPLNNYVPIEESANPMGENIAPDPAELLVSEESYKELLGAVSEILSGFEKKILGYYLEGLSYEEISAKVSKPPKSIDNAVQRIRRKFSQYLANSGDNG